ncbi:MAG: cation diffusion facilitator family transporter [Deltaproteobacteria bacterium]|nr:cation diffusion facilitator family transporter [Deltaproteobacteria bacterium]
MKESRVSVYAALAANLAITITKFIAAAASGSTSLFSEGVHSVVDSSDSLLLLLGLTLSKRGPSKEHPYGQGLQVYFWTLVVAMSIAGMGGGISIYEGVLHIAKPHQIADLGWAYGVLIASFVFEGTSLVISWRSFQRTRRGLGVWQGIRRAKDPTTFVVVLEDSAALIGLVLAAAGLTGARYLGLAWADGGASIAIGLLLLAVAIVLGRETWSLLLGEAANEDLVKSVRDIARNQPGIVTANAPITMHFGPDHVHVDLEVEVDRSLSVGELVDTTRALEDKIRERHPVVWRVWLHFVEPKPA